MSPFRRLAFSCVLAAFAAAITPVLRAQTTVLNETFSGGSTVNSNPTAPATPAVTAVAYQQLAAKSFNPNPPVISPGNLRFGIVATSSGFNHLQALFTKYPVTLASAGDYIELTVSFVTEGGIITAQTNSTLFFGLHNAGQVQPVPGGLNGTSANALAGYAQTWQGYVNRIFYAGGNSGFYTRPAQGAAGANNQDVLYNYAGASGVGSTSPSTLAAFTSGGSYTAVFRITKLSATSLRLNSSLYSGAAASGTPLYTQTANSTSVLTSVFDAFAIGWRATGSVPSVMNVKSVRIITTGTTTVVPAILTQPLGLTKSVGESFNLSVVADGGTGTALSYQWHKNGAPIPGATAATHEIPSVTLGDAGDYTVVVTNIAGSTTSATATLVVTTGAVAPSIVTHPAGATILVGGSHTFSATVNGTSPLTYQWQHSSDGGLTFADVAGANSTSFTLSSATLASAGHYRIAATNAQGAAVSNPALLVVQQAPVINTQPTGGTLNPGDAITLSVAASGTPAPTFQWRRNGAAIAGATDATYTITNASGAQAGNYTVVVTNAVGAVTSNPASVVVLSPTLAAVAFAPGSADACNPDTRLTLTFNAAIQPGISGVLRIHDAATHAVVDSIDLVAATALRDTLRTGGVLSTQLLPVQTKPIGALPNNFNYYPVTVSGSTATIHPRNNVLAYGKTYYVTADAGVFVDAAGEGLAAISDPSAWRFSTKPSGPAAGSTTLVVAADGSGDFDTLQAALDFIPANNAVPTLIRVRAGTYFEQVGFNAKHFVTILGENAAQTILTYPNNNTFNNVSGVYHRSVFLAQSVHDFTLANLTIINSTPQNGSQAECIVVNGTGAASSRNLVTGCRFFSYQDTVQFNKQTYVSDCVIQGDVDFMWGDGPAFLENCDIRILRNGGMFTQIRNGSGNHGYVFRGCRFTAPAGITGTFFGRIDPAGFPYSEVVVLDSTVGDASNNAFLATATGTSGSNYLGGWWQLNNTSSAASASNVHNWSANLVDANGAPLNDPNGDAFTAMPTDAATLSNYRNATWVLNTNLAGTVNGSWTPSLAPLIAAQPKSVATIPGQPAVLEVAALGVPAPSFQWQKGGVDIPGATSATLSITAVAAGDAGVYRVVVANAFGTVASDVALLEVQGVSIPPTILTQPVSQLIAEGSSGLITVSAVGTQPLTYQWYKGAAAMAGATGASLAFTNAGSGDSGTYTVEVSNSGGTVASNPAVITVKGIAAIAKTGFAANVTGGAAGETVTVSTAAALKTYAESASPYTIVVSGTIDLGFSGRIKLQSNKTLRGATTQSTILGTVNISNVDNVIVSNLNISANTGEPSTNDGVTIANSTNVLVTKCTIYDCTDGNLDVINGSDLVTISWCRFYYTRNNGHNFSNLVGSSDTDTGSGDGITNYRVTWHHNWWNTGAKQRMIACRFGSAHMYNNYWDCAGNDYCTETRNMAAIFSEHNYYDGVKNPLARRLVLPSDRGLLMTIGNVFDGCTGSQETGSNLVFTPAYSYALAQAADVPAAVMQGAGNVPYDAPEVLSATIAAVPGAPAVGGSVTLSATPAGFTPTAYQWRRDNVAIAGATDASLTLTNLQLGQTGTYAVVLGAGDGSVVSAPYELQVHVPPAITQQPTGATVTAGDSISFTVAAAGEAPLSFQWFKGGQPVAGATGATLTLGPVTTAEAGEYRCTVTNVAGSATSDLATLVVNRAVATVTVADATMTYDGTAKTLAVTTVPAGLPVELTYNGAAGAAVNAGTYAVVATVVHADYVGSGGGTLVINPAPATVTLGALVQTYGGTPRAATATTDPAGLPVTLAYDGVAAAPVDAGVYAVVATVADPNYAGSAAGQLQVNRAAAEVIISNVAHTYDGLPKSATVTTVPAGLPLVITYDGSSASPTVAGSYAVAATVNHRNFSGFASETLVIAKAPAIITLSPLVQRYDGQPKPVAAVTAPAGLAVELAYDGAAAAPIYPGPHAVRATVADANYAAVLDETLLITVTALVRHAPALNGDVDGSVQVLLPESVALNGGASVAGDLLVPGTPALRLNGKPTFAGTRTAGGEPTPASHTITLNGGSVLRYLVTGVDPIGLPVIAVPPPPTGERDVIVNAAGQSIGDPATLRHLTLNGGAGEVVLPPGSYGDVVTNGSSTLVLGTPGSTEPAVYTLRGLAVNGSSQVKLAGPVLLTLANGGTTNGRIGDLDHPDWLALDVATGGLTLNSGAVVTGTVNAPNGAIILNGNALLRGSVAADRLILNGGAVLEDTE